MVVSGGGKGSPHRHVVLSIPKILRRYFLYDRKLLSDLSRCGWEALKAFYTAVTRDHKKILKHLGLWDVKRKPRPVANAPPIDVFPAYDEQPEPSADDPASLLSPRHKYYFSPDASPDRLHQGP